MSAEKPVIVLVHGAFHPPVLYRKLIEPLRELGYPVLAPPLPTTGLDDSVAGKTYVDDVKRIFEALDPYLSEGKEAVLLCHSQGGIAGSAATEGQTVAERQKRGLKGGIKAIVYMAAFALPEKGASLMSSIGGKPGPFYDERGPFYVVNEKGPAAFFGMLPEAEQQAVFKGLVHQSKASKNAPAHFVASNVSVPKTYIICTEDLAFPAAGQRAWAAMTGCESVEITSDHSPFLRDDAAKKVVDILAGVASK